MTKNEIQMTKESRMTNFEMGCLRPVSDAGFVILSSFVIRHSSWRYV